LSKEES